MVFKFEWNLFVFYIKSLKNKAKRKENFDVFVQKSAITFFFYITKKRAFEDKLGV